MNAAMMVAPHDETSADPRVDRSEAIIRTSFARFDVRALAIATAAVGALLLFLLTAALLLQAAGSGAHTGAHLGLLAGYFPGYTVSWAGSLVGTVYGGLVGAAIGFAFGFCWNLSHFVFLTLALLRRGPGADL